MSSIPRFFVPPDAIRDDKVALPPEAAHHALSVLRLRPGESLLVHDGRGNACTCRLLPGSTSKQATAHIEAVHPVSSEPVTRVTIAQALPKTSDKIEQVLQHATEAGAAGFVFWAGARSVARLAEGEKIEKRLLRWRGIVQSAAEQSGRGVLPSVDWCGLAPALAQTFANYDAVVVLHEGAQTPLRVALDALPLDAVRLLLIIGPEGGLTPEVEVPLFAASGGQAVTLGPRVLRTETAALIALAQVLYHRGE